MTDKATIESKKRELMGEVISDKMDKTIVVEVARRVRHPRYQKVMMLYKKFYAHDEKSACSEGDVVRIVETRPLSKLKRWRVTEILEHGGVERAEV